MPRAFCGHMLERFWGYKYHQDSQEDLGHSGINLHADMASINVNFWVGAPQMDHAPADHGGGMKVYLKHVPDSWGFKDYQGPQGGGPPSSQSPCNISVKHASSDGQVGLQDWIQKPPNQPNIALWHPRWPEASPSFDVQRRR
eukprot:gnl/TRDRNA2_/TRDRNA2_171104_c1_seq1.p1 gnl/TRDRNA2_/TRDRNA2_171104_c1~~gnl/TRDRNA2_/TRDRNA2_171104_c1_seq1.p1  ORF type:complete len:142 (+),score=15.86 gnl/TRDRNA2_/TRDRNA2_171104_c1_seq1:306-731(+)